MAQSLGVDEVHSELLPADKVSQVERLLGQSGGKLAFVGDGINDAPVLSRADIGIAMGAMGSDAAIEAADVVLMDDDPLKIAKAIRISRKCIRIVYENIAFALIVKALCLLLVAVGAANFFGASMALGAFLSGMVVGQSEFSSQAAAEALPMRDAFAVLFFVSVGMLFNPASLISDWPLILATLGIVLIGKPLAAFIVVKLFGKPLRMALSVAVALAQIGEFSFILAAMGVSFGVLPKEASSAIIVTAIVSITLNPLLYRRINGAAHWLESKGIGLPRLDENELSHPEGAQRIIVVGYGPVGKQLTGILRDNNLDVVVVEMNIDTVRQVSALGEKIIYGDATQREVLLHAGAEEAEGLIISSSSAPAGEIVEVARAINPNLRILVHTTYLRVAENLKSEGVSAVFSGEREVAVAMTEHLMRDFGATDEQIDRERRKLRERMA